MTHTYHSFDMRRSYLESVIPVMNYRPKAIGRTSQKISEDEKRAFRKRFLAKGLNEEAVIAIEKITRADSIDYQVNATYTRRPSFFCSTIRERLPSILYLSSSARSLDISSRRASRRREVRS